MKLNLRRDGNRKAMSPPLEWEIDVIQQKRFDLFSRKAYNRKGFIHLHILVPKFHRNGAIVIGRHRPLLYAGLNGRWTEFGVKDMIFEQKKLKVNLHFPVGEFQ